MSGIHDSNNGFEARRRTCCCVNFGSRVSSLLSENVRKQTKAFLSVTLDGNRQTFQTLAQSKHNEKSICRFCEHNSHLSSAGRVNKVHLLIRRGSLRAARQQNQNRTQSFESNYAAACELKMRMIATAGRQSPLKDRLPAFREKLGRRHWGFFR